MNFRTFLVAAFVRGVKWAWGLWVIFVGFLLVALGLTVLPVIELVAWRLTLDIVVVALLTVIGAYLLTRDALVERTAADKARRDAEDKTGTVERQRDEAIFAAAAQLLPGIDMSDIRAANNFGPGVYVAPGFESPIKLAHGDFTGNAGPAVALGGVPDPETGPEPEEHEEHEEPESGEI